MISFSWGGLTINRYPKPLKYPKKRKDVIPELLCTNKTLCAMAIKYQKFKIHFHKIIGRSKIPFNLSFDFCQCHGLCGWYLLERATKNKYSALQTLESDCLQYFARASDCKSCFADRNKYSFYRCFCVVQPSSHHHLGLPSQYTAVLYTQNTSSSSKMTCCCNK